MNKEKLKRFKVTQSLRFGGTGPKLLFYAGAVLELAAIITVITCLTLHKTGLLGTGIIAAIIAFIWLFAVRMMSESSFGLAQIAFRDSGMVYRASGAKDAPEYLMSWDDCRFGGIIKVRLSYWVYMSDHELSPAERRDFPDHVCDGVYYFNYADNTWEEFMKFVPEPFKSQLEAEKTEKGVR